MPDSYHTEAEQGETLILDAVDRFLERDVRPYVRELEAADEYPAEIADKMAELGLFGATISASSSTLFPNRKGLRILGNSIGKNTRILGKWYKSSTSEIISANAKTSSLSSIPL